MRKKIHYLKNYILHHCEISTTLKKNVKFSNPPIFIIGAPRSGSTLLYQVLSDYYDVGYLSNLHCKFYGAPSYVEHFLHPLQRRKSQDYTSYHGKTEGWTAPSECGQFWYRFFRRKPQYVPLEEVKPQKISQLRSVVSALVKAYNKPVLFKNLYCSLRLKPIAQAIPESLFIVIDRNVIDNSHSLLEGRKKVYGNYETWWSAEPPEIEYLKTLPPYQQVVEQIRHIYALIEKDKEDIGKERFLKLSYEGFCDNTHNILRKIDSFLNSQGININHRKELSQIPTNFSRRDQVKIDPDLYSQLVSYVQQES